MPAVRATFVASRMAVSAAGLRADVRRYLAEQGVPEGRIGDVVLVLSELVTNAIEASPEQGRVEVLIERSGATICLDVTNQAATVAPPWPPMTTVEMPTAVAVRGRGLPLVAALAARMSIEVGDELTRVRAELRA